MAINMFNKKNSKDHILTIIILSVFFGFFAGIIGSLSFRAYLLERIFPEFREINLSNSSANSGIVIRDAKNVIVQQDDKTVETIKNIENSLIGIYKKSDLNAQNNSANINNNIGEGIIITSDGWAATTFGTADDIKISDYSAVSKDKKIYSIDKIIKDKKLNLNFLHFKASDLPVLSITKISEIKRGQLVLAVNWKKNTNQSYVSNILNSPNTNIISSDVSMKKIIVSSNVNLKDFQGSIFFSLSGGIIGFINDKNEIIPGSYLENDLKSILKFGTIKKPSLGLNYMDLSQLANGPISVGNIISKSSTSPAIIPKSSAQTAELKEGDIILSVNGIDLSSDIDIAVAINNFLPGEKIKISFLRDKKELETEALLK
jgi:S1-C subfamily serine protease